MKVNEQREHIQKFRLYFDCLRSGHWSKDCKKRTCSVPSCERHQNKLLHTEFQKKEAITGCLRCYDSSSNNDHTRGLPFVRIKLVNGNHSLSVQEMCDTGSLISFVDKSIVSTRQLQGQRACLSVAGIHGSQFVKTEIVPISASAHKKSRPVTTVQFDVHQKQNLGDQIVDQQGLKDRYPHLRKLPNQS